MSTTNHLGITLVEQAQAQKEVTVNQAFTRIDAMLNTGAISRITNTPPASPGSGDLYIIGPSPTGAWSSQAGKIGYFDQLWKFIAPGAGVMLWVNDESLSYIYNGTSWVANSSGETNTASNLGAGTGLFGSKSGVDLRFKSLIAGSNVTITNTSTDVTINASVTGGGGGTVTSVTLSMPAEFSVSGSPVTGAGTLAVTKANTTKNTLYAGPSSGSAAAPSFRALTVSDLPVSDLVSYSMFGGF